MLLPPEVDVSVLEGDFSLTSFDVLDFVESQQLSPCSNTSVNTFLRDLIQQGVSQPTVVSNKEESETQEEVPKQQTNGRVPRHRKNSHIKAEKKRRKKIHEQLRSLHDCVPALAPSKNDKRLSELESLEETGKYIKERKVRHDTRKDEIEKLKRERESLKMELNTFQAALPSSGLKDTRQDSILDRYDAYTRRKFTETWRYGLYDRIVGRKLAKSYAEQTNTSTAETYIQSLMKWTGSCLTLTNLRPAVITGLRNVSTSTSILVSPTAVKQELALSMQQHVSTTLPATATTSVVTTAAPTAATTTTTSTSASYSPSS
ncbi:carbohydrate-responsive element-binding protein-like [Haliotis rufescens]|uniref:carbohydrate-responsive element-binding protein-like n=1 Tax=Haliotis rufescens TaxID=6454 RepID=UPI00201E795D|nr:carbohydrate-responsive element-binding protein-like [Haliotis rufescens]